MTSRALTETERVKNFKKVHVKIASLNEKSTIITRILINYL